MKTAVVTIAIGKKFEDQAKLTHPTLKAYADKIGAEFVVIDKSFAPGTPHWEKFQLYNLLVTYNRIIYLDTDIIVREDCPNLFELVPENKLGIFNEGRFENRFASLQEAYREYDVPFPEKWDGTYYNTGVMVLSRRHRVLFKMPARIVSLGMFEQGYINMKIQELDNNKEKEERVFELDYKFNRMTLLDSYCGVHRCDSYMVHYAGAPPQVDISRLIREDQANWQAHYPKYEYEREIVIYMGGGMGDQLSAEPVARFTMEHMFKDMKTNYTIVTNWPRFFYHLGVPCYVREVYESHPRYDTPVKVLKTIPAPEESTLWQTWSHISGHTLDYAAVSTIHRILPDDCREIKLQASIEGLTEVLDIMGDMRGDMVLVHPGRGWDSKTFPTFWWEAVIEGLQAEGRLVGVIGQQIDNDQGYVKDLNLPEGVIDFRDLLSLDGLIALIATSSIVISNDSAPIHIAGAFDNNILLIATCRHPDYILPYRKGSKTYKTFAFKKKLTIDDWDLSPTRIFKESADVVKGDILDYIPEPQEVVAKAIEMVGVVEIKPSEEQIDSFMSDTTTVKYERPVMWSDLYEPEVAGFLRKNLLPGDNMIDVGANTGIFTALASELVEKEGKVVAFEPEKHMYEQLVNNTKGLTNVNLVNAAAGDDNQQANLFYNYDNDGGHALWDPANFGQNQMTRKNKRIIEKVDMVTLDSTIDFVPKIIKIDTEGCELKVLRGAQRILKEHKPFVISEINKMALMEMGTSDAELGKFMTEMGYQAYSLPEEKKIHLGFFDVPYLNYNMVFKPEVEEVLWE